MEESRKPAFWVLFTCVISAGAAVAAYALPHAQPTVALGFFAIAVVLQASPAQMAPGVYASLAFVAELVALAYGGLPLVVVSVLGTAIVNAAVVKGSGRLIKGTYNIGMLVLSGAAAAVVYSGIVGAPLMSGLQPTEALAQPVVWSVGLVAAAVAYAAVNTTALAAAVHLTAGVPLRQTIRGLATQAAMPQFLYAGLAAIAYVLLVKVDPAALILLTVPLLVARRALMGVQQRQEAFDRMVKVFVKAIEVKDGYTRGHAERVADLSVMVAASMGLSYEDRQLIRYGAILHDVGKIGVSLGILCKAGPLTDDEFDEMKLHPQIGAEMLHDIDFLKPALSVVHHHHERLDGRGYPAGLKGEEIPLLTRIVTAVDAFDAMTSTRSYRRALDVEIALRELEHHAGSQFDPEVVGHLVALIREQGWVVTDEPVATAPVLAPVTS